MTQQKRHANGGLRKLCACPRRRWPTCGHSWYFNFKPRGGQSYRFALDKHFNRHVDSKTEAEELAGDLRKQIRAGKFEQPAPREGMTLRQLCDAYVEGYVQSEHPDTIGDFRSVLDVICHTPVPAPTGGAATFGAWRVADIVTDSIERFRKARRSAIVDSRRGSTGLGGTNRSTAKLRALFNWAVLQGYVEGTPFRRQHLAVVRLPKEPARSRRLRDGEGAALLAACSPHLRAVVECALETGMRKGEILSLRWRQVEGMRIEGSAIAWAPRAEVVLQAADTKTREPRRIPVSSRLRAVLEMRRVDPAGEPMPADAHVFGNAIGQRVHDVKRSWPAAVLRAHGHQPQYVRPSMRLTAECQAALDAIDLHFHDLRREAGSR